MSSRRVVVESESGMQPPEPGKADVLPDPIPMFGRIFAVLACAASALAWLWFTSLMFIATAMISIIFHAPLHVRFALSRSAMDALVADMQADPDAVRPSSMRVGLYFIETQPDRWKRDDGALRFVLSEDREAGFAYSATPITGYAGGNPGAGGSLGGGWYWFSDD